MTATTHTSALRRTTRALGRFWQHLAEAAANPQRPLNDAKWSDYPRFPWF
jgi:hypothetical protein